MAILGCELESIWNYLKPNQLGTPVRGFVLMKKKSFEVGRPTLSLDLLRWEDRPLI